MGNYYHLMIEALAPNLSRGLKRLHGTYTQWFNRRHQRVSHLLQGRFKSLLVEKGERPPGAVPLCGVESCSSRNGEGGRRVELEQLSRDRRFAGSARLARCTSRTVPLQ